MARVLLEHFFFLSVVFYFYRLAMTQAITIDAVQKALAFTKAGADIIFLMDKKGVDEDVQAKLYHIGVVSVELFSVFAKDQTDLEAILKVHFGIDTSDIFLLAGQGQQDRGRMASRQDQGPEADRAGWGVRGKTCPQGRPRTSLSLRSRQ